MDEPFGDLIPPPNNILVHALFRFLVWFKFSVSCFFTYGAARCHASATTIDDFGWRYLMPLAMLNMCHELWLAYMIYNRKIFAALTGARTANRLPLTAALYCGLSAIQVRCNSSFCPFAHSAGWSDQSPAAEHRSTRAVADCGDDVAGGAYLLLGAEFLAALR